MRYIRPEKKVDKGFPWFLVVVGFIAALATFLAVSSWITPPPNSGMSFADDRSPVMYFYSDTCGACRTQKPVLQELAAEGFRVKLMDVGAHPNYLSEYGVDVTPTFLAADSEKLVGVTQRDELRPWLEAHGARIANATQKH